MHRRRRRQITLGLLAGAMLCVDALGEPEAPSLIAASTDTHLWFVLRGRKGFDLSHHGVEMEGPHFDVVAPLTNCPEAVGAWSERVWLVLPPRPGAGESRRDILTLEVQYASAVGLYSTSPSGRFDIAPALPGSGILAGFAGTAQGPVALLIPPQRASATVSAGEHSQAAEPLLDHPQLLGLHSGGWTEIQLPPEFRPTGKCFLAASGTDGRSIAILSSASSDSTPARLFLRDSLSQRWEVSSSAQNVRDVQALAPAGNQIAALLREGNREEIQIAYLRAGGMLPLAHIPGPRLPVALAGLQKGLQILEVGADVPLTVREVDPITGEVSPPLAWTVQPIGDRLWQVALLGAIVTASLLLVFVVRPDPGIPLALPAGLSVMGIGRRAAALAIDLVPGAIATMVILRCQPVDLLHPPLVTLNVSQAVPFMLTVTITAIHSGVTEMAAATTLGKAIFRGRVTTMNGGRPTRAKLLARNLVKLIVMLVPPLALVAFLNPHRQGMADLFAHTVVVQNPVPAAD